MRHMRQYIYCRNGLCPGWDDNAKLRDVSEESDPHITYVCRDCNYLTIFPKPSSQSSTSPSSTTSPSPSLNGSSPLDNGNRN